DPPRGDLDPLPRRKAVAAHRVVPQVEPELLRRRGAPDFHGDLDQAPPVDEIEEGVVHVKVRVDSLPSTISPQRLAAVLVTPFIGIVAPLAEGGVVQAELRVRPA